MNRAQAKEILLLYRPGSRDTEDPDMTQALELARQDPELGKWFTEHQAFQAAMRAKFQEIPVPAHLQAALRAGPKVVRPALWHQPPVWLAAAAVFVVLVGLAAFWLKPSVPDRFVDYRESMVSAAEREYIMDLTTNDRNQLRQFIATRGAPADYQLTPGLAGLQLKGGGSLRWRGNPVSMVCFDRGTNKMLFLFVVKRAALKDPPPLSPASAELGRVADFQTASWTQGNDTYLLAGAEEPGFARRYLAP